MRRVRQGRVPGPRRSPAATRFSDRVIRAWIHWNKLRQAGFAKLDTKRRRQRMQHEGLFFNDRVSASNFALRRING